jgi:transcriptional regulator with XRE-family HTH domain
MAVNKDFADYVRNLIADRSLRAIAIKMEVSPTTVSNMLSGRIPTDDILTRFADAVGEPRDQMRKRAKVYRAAAEMRKTLNFLPESAVDSIVEFMEEAEREQSAKEV